MTGIYLSAAHKSSGKTTITIGLCAALTEQGKSVQSFKKGPDYIDAGWLAIVSDFFLGAHPASRGGSSLDDTFRFIQGAEPGWVLSVTEFAAFDRGTVCGQARHFAEDGRLLAISSQTGVLPRLRQDLIDQP